MPLQPQAEFSVPLPVTKPVVGPELSPWYWHPYRVGVRFAPKWFMDRVREIDPSEQIEVVWDPVIERWIVWCKEPTIQQPICWGWKLLFIVRDDEHEYVPLDERVLAKIYDRSPKKWGNGKQYFDAIVREFERDKEQKAQAHKAHIDAGSADYFDHMKIRVGYGKSSGSKFADFHA